jgi:uncharacterized protein (TIGR02270 family)
VGYLLEQHLEELAFLNVQRRFLLFAPNVSIEGLAEHDERLAAHWDGLAVGGPASVELAFDRLNEFDPWDVFAAVRVWLELGSPTTEQILEQMEAAEPDSLAAWREALRRIPPELLDRLLPTAETKEASDKVQAALVFARSWHGRQKAGDLPALAKKDCVESRRTLARVLGWGVMDIEPASGLLEKLVDDPDPAVARAALWSAVMLGNGEAVDHCRDLVHQKEADAFHIQILGLMGQPADSLLLRPLLDQDELFPATVRALALTGSIQAVPWLLDRLTGDEDVDEDVIAGLSLLLGELPDPEDLEGLEVPEGQVPLAVWWAKVSGEFPVSGTWLRGRLRPWALAAEDEPMESLWLSCLRNKDVSWNWLRRELPDGFFAAGENTEVVPGE